MRGRFDGRIALITGADSGIGFATARRLHAEGAIVIAGVLQDGPQPDRSCDTQSLDVRNEADWDRVIEHILTMHGRLDVLVNNAGVHKIADIEATTRGIWDSVMEVNAYGTFLGCKKAIPVMRRQGGGSIVNLSSIAAIRGVSKQVAYAVTKGAILTLTLALAADHVADGIRVNCVCPGATDTPIIANMVASGADLVAIVNRSPMARLAHPDEVAAAIAYLASDDASHTTGTALPVDGGRSGR